jgi:hypothetical protein
LIVSPLQSGHHAVSLGSAPGAETIRTSFILPPQDGQRRVAFPSAGATVPRLTLLNHDWRCAGVAETLAHDNRLNASLSHLVCLWLA